MQFFDEQWGSGCGKVNEMSFVGGGSFAHQMTTIQAEARPCQQCRLTVKTALIRCCCIVLVLGGTGIVRIVVKTVHMPNSSPCSSDFRVKVASHEAIIQVKAGS